jgi:formate-dependent nitrite reductase membrane component NrfD
MMLAALLLAVGADGSELADLVPGLIALAGIAVTGWLLVSDLTRPLRFHYLFTRPQWRSWLAIGAQFISLAAIVAFLFTAAAAFGWDGLRDVLRWPMVPAGVMLAAYTAFLFNQCEGRDLWQSPLLLPHTLVNALIAGAGALAVVGLFVEAPDSVGGVLGWTLGLGVVAGALLIALDLSRHGTDQAERAALNLRRDLYARRFWIGGVGVGLLAPALLAAVYLAGGGAGVLAAGGLLALVGLWLYEDAWVRAGQSVPLS